MPEGHTIHRLARDHTRDLAGRSIEAPAGQERCGRCGAALDVYPLAGRTTWSCPTCQPH